MLETIYSLPFLVLEVPNLRIKQPTWFHQPSAMTIFSLVLLSYFLVTGGIEKILLNISKRIVWMFWLICWFNVKNIHYRNYLRCNCRTTIRWIDHWWTWPLPAGCLHAIPNQWTVHRCKWQNFVTNQFNKNHKNEINYYLLIQNYHFFFSNRRDWPAAFYSASVVLASSSWIKLMHRERQN